jgi:hypothetical protein
MLPEPSHGGEGISIDQREDREMQFIDQIVEQEVIPQLTAQHDHDVPPGLPFERRDLPVEIRPSQDASVLLPGEPDPPR